MTLEEVREQIGKRYEDVQILAGRYGGATLVVNGLPFACSAWFPEDGVTERFLRYLVSVLDRLDARDFGLDPLDED